MALFDKHGRVHDYLRISLTDACNLRCTYCMPDEPVFSPPSGLMNVEEILTISRFFVGNGVRKIRLTGGEPLVRKDFNEIVIGLSGLRPEGLDELTLTTNGILIDRHINLLADAGVKSVNVSLDTLLPERFASITKRNRFHRLMSNLHLLLDRNFIVKVNVVVMKGVNDDEVVEFIRWTRDYPFHVRFIEFMPFEGNRWQDKRLIRSAELLERSAAFFDFQPVDGKPHDTARTFRVLGFSGSFAFISTMSEPFCGECNRIRLTADGKIKNCLFSRTESDLLSVLRAGGDLYNLVRGSISSKEARWGGQSLFEGSENRSMVAIGG